MEHKHLRREKKLPERKEGENVFGGERNGTDFHTFNFSHQHLIPIEDEKDEKQENGKEIYKKLFNSNLFFGENLQHFFLF